MQLALLAFLPEITPKTPDFGRTWTRNAAARSELDATFRVLRLYAPIIPGPSEFFQFSFLLPVGRVAEPFRKGTMARR
jgi:hypothetical protein